ncbi:hypothetical protein [Leptolyngbya sp. FACHB-261]|uniref:hypothetical protein n=1 Tax=Leptolyngbya sp. FACHB-261 TaxID=2692806 RepID=UPI00168728CB|nr:hypothetical protein [Leptolyngbya sp. FACHB-261]MBD2105314.1 hypothetical protein [Leptolyngbya sp. FACHB-261]
MRRLKIGLVLKPSVDDKWLSLDEASQDLGNGYSRSSILRRIKEKQWKEGYHWIDVSASSRKNGKRFYKVYKINVSAVRRSWITSQ